MKDLFELQEERKTILAMKPRKINRWPQLPVYFTLTFLMMITMAYGQNKSSLENPNGHINTDGSFYGTLSGSSSLSVIALPPENKPTFIRLHIAPEIPKDSTWSDVKIYRMSYPKQTKESYEIMVANTCYYQKDKFKYIDIRFTINGRKTDYTFEEFKKYLWP